MTDTAKPAPRRIVKIKRHRGVRVLIAAPPRPRRAGPADFASWRDHAWEGSQ